MRRKPLLLLLLALGLLQCKPKKDVKPESEPRGETIPVGDNSRVSLDWDGTYLGVLPCADCLGVLTRVVLTNLETYELYRIYLGKGREAVVEAGTFQWDASGGKITLEETDGLEFYVGENRLTLADIPEDAVLPKAGSWSELEGTYWKLVELGSTPLQVPEGNPEAFLLMLPQQGRAMGHGGCNSFTGSYKADGESQVEFSKLAVTAMACPDADYEAEYLKILNAARTYEILRDTLTLGSPEAASAARFVAAYPKKESL